MDVIACSMPAKFSYEKVDTDQLYFGTLALSFLFCFPKRFTGSVSQLDYQDPKQKN